MTQPLFPEYIGGDDPSAVMAQWVAKNGSFVANTTVSQKLKEALHTGVNWGKTPLPVREGLERACGQISAIVNGDPMQEMHWVDLIGYLNLVLCFVEVHNDSK